MRKSLFCAAFALAASALAGCGASAQTISVCASELPHAKILRDCVAPIVAEDGYSLKVTVLDWTLQNDAVANGDYDANYFQHIPYLLTYDGQVSLSPACKVHYERLCLYSSALPKKAALANGDRIEMVNDISNAERALQLLASYSYLTIKDSAYADGVFSAFDPAHPNDFVTWAAGYENCSLTCLSESSLCVSLPDYDFGIIPGNTAMTGLGSDYASRIVLSEKADESLISAKANIIAVRTGDLANPKTAELVKALGDERVASFIASSFGESVIYHYENLL
jgi:D-methionine transport system substrate-binding protein